MLNLLEEVKKGNIDLVLFTKLDRWFRSVGDYYEVQRTLDEFKVPWRAIWEDYETETSSGVFKVNIMLSVAQSEADRTSERIKDTMRYKAAKGDYVGKAPIGYMIKNGALVKDPKTSNGIQMFFDEYLKEFSKAKALQKCHLNGFDFSESTLKTAIKNPAYSGNCKNGYKCEPYISEYAFERIQDHLKNYTRTPKHDYTYLYGGMVECGYCHRGMHARAKGWTDTQGTRKYYNVYACEHMNDFNNPCVSVIISERKLEKYLLQNLDDIIDQKIAYQKVKDKKNAQADSKIIPKLESKLKRLANLYADGDISLEEYRTKRDSIKAEIENLKPINTTNIPQMPSNWQDIYKELTPANKKAFWNKHIEKIIVTNETKKHPKIVFGTL